MIDTDKYEEHTCAYCEEVIEEYAIRTNDEILYHDYCFDAVVRRDIRTEEDIQEVIE